MARYERYAPDFKIRINDKDLPAGVRASVVSVRYQDGRQAADRVEVGLANSDLRWLQGHIRGLGFRPFPTGIRVGPVRALEAAPEGTFDLDNKLTLDMGYAPDPLEEMFEGEITGLQVSFPSGGIPTMTLIAHDYLHRLTQGKYARGFGFLPDYLVAGILSAENLLIPFIDPAISSASTALAALNYIFNGTGVKQKEESDLDLLTRIAATYDADFWVEGNTLYMTRFIKEYTPSVTLTWGESLMEFSPQVTTIGQVPAVSMKFTLREIPVSFLVTVSYDFDREAVSLSIIPGQATAAIKSINEITEMIVDQPVNNPADIVNSALVIARELRNKLNNRLTGSGSAIGDPRIRAGAVIRLEGLGQDFSGDYRVTTATHSIDGSGYRTSFEVRKEIIP